VEQRRVGLERGSAVTAVVYPSVPSGLATLVLGHGAGAGQSSDFMTGYADALAGLGLNVVTFNFPFTERGRKIPDPQPVLEACFRAVLTDVALDPTLARLPLFIGGKSLGGRIASHVAASRDADEPGLDSWWDRLRGLVLLGYPLHPPGKPQQLRVGHLTRLSHPILIVQGSRDAFGTPLELRVFLDVLPVRSTLHVVEGGDHSFAVPKRSGVQPAEIMHSSTLAIAEWIASNART
jgi:uncharacterized protein